MLDNHIITFSIALSQVLKDSSSDFQSKAEAVVAVVCVVCSFTAGLLLGVLVTLCNVHYHKKQKRDQTERPPVYESIPHYQHMCLYSDKQVCISF